MLLIKDPSTITDENAKLVATACIAAGMDCFLHQVRESLWIHVRAKGETTRYFSPLHNMDDAMQLLEEMTSLGPCGMIITKNYVSVNTPTNSGFMYIDGTRTCAEAARRCIVETVAGY